MDLLESRNLLANGSIKPNNWPPTPSEYQSLLRLQALNRQEESGLQVELILVKKRLEDVNEGNQARKTESDGDLAGTHATQELVTRVEKQLAALEVEYQELKRRLHPLRWCPEDVLRQIFLMAYQLEWDDEYGKPRQFARYMSQVCQMWRHTALQIGRLWSYLRADSKQKMEYIAGRADLAVKRIQAEGAYISIVDNGTLSVEDIKAVQLNSFPYIDLVHFELQKPALLAHQECNYINGRLKTLRIDRLASTEPIEALDLEKLLDNFPTMERLELQYIFSGGALTELTRSYELIRGLHLGHTDLPGILWPWSSFPNLQELSLRHVTLITLGFLRRLDLPNLLILKLTSRMHPPLSIFHVPRLEKLVLDCTVTINDVEFISQLQNLTDLAIDLEDAGFRKLMGVIPNLNSLRLKGPHPWLYDWTEDDSKSPPFPKLTNIGLDMRTTGSDIGLEEFDRLVAARCLPRSNDDPRAQSLTLLKELSIINANGKLLPTPIWRKSELLRHCILTTSTEDDMTTFENANSSLDYFPLIYFNHMTWIR